MKYKPNALALLGLLLFAGSGAQASINVPGAVCHLEDWPSNQDGWPADPNVRYQSSGLSNQSQSAEWVTCPIQAEVDLGTTPQFDVYVFDGTSSDNIRCVVDVYDRDGNTLARSGLKSTTDSETGKRRLSFELPAMSSATTSYGVHCELPGVGVNGTASRGVAIRAF